MIEYAYSVRELLELNEADNWESAKPELIGIEGVSEGKRGILIASYSKFVDELLEMDKAKPEPVPQDTVLVTLVKANEDTFNDEDYLDVCIKNKTYVEDPEEELSPWGGNSKDKDDCPDGYYNCNWHGYQKVYGISGIDLLSLLDNKVMIENEETLEYIGSTQKLLAAILMEMSFTGFSNKERVEFMDEMKRRLESIKDGTAEMFTIEEARQKLIGSEVIHYEDPLKKNESERKGR